MPRSSRASRQASLAWASSPVGSPYGPGSGAGRLRRAVSSRPTAATRIASAVTAPNTHPVVSRVRANAWSGSSTLRMYPTSRKIAAAVPARTGARTATTATAPAPTVSAASPTVVARFIAPGPGSSEPDARAGDGAAAVGAGQALFLTDLHIVLVLGRGGRCDEGGGAECHGAQLFGGEPLSGSGQFRAVWCGAQRLVEEPLVLLAVLAQQVLRNAVHLHPPMLRRAWGSHADEPSGRNGGEPATDKPMVER
ncbi:hypothetical protein SGLAM104S_10281 [Streptomyces glaucescens]